MSLTSHLLKQGDGGVYHTQTLTYGIFVPLLDLNPHSHAGLPNFSL